VLKYFDSDQDGKLHFPDFIQMILPCTNSTMRAEVTQRIAAGCNPDEFLTMDVEQDMVRLFKMETELHVETELIKQKYDCMPETSADTTFAFLDSAKIGFLEGKSFVNFFKRLGTKITSEQMEALMRRIEFDGGKMVSKAEFHEFVSPQEPYSKLLTREILKDEEDFAHVDSQKPNGNQSSEKPKKDLKALKAHNERIGNKVAPTLKLDALYMNVSGVSPIRCRHPIDLYGV
jgi:Ca2+-binding EF-hand superfamily protein